MNSLNIEFFGYIAAILTTAAFLPQLIKTLKTKKAEDVSLVTLIMFICGVGSWIIYGYKISSLPILIGLGFTFIILLGPTVNKFIIDFIPFVFLWLWCGDSTLRPVE